MKHKFLLYAFIVAILIAVIAFSQPKPQPPECLNAPNPCEGANGFSTAVWENQTLIRYVPKGSMIDWNGRT